jgi:hypothetical protein
MICGAASIRQWQGRTGTTQVTTQNHFLPPSEVAMATFSESYLGKSQPVFWFEQVEEKNRSQRYDKSRR